MDILNIIWDINPSIDIFGFTLRIYGLCFAIGLTLGATYLIDQSRRINYSDRHIELLIILSFVGIFLGARLVHCLFYEPTYYLYRPLEMFLPIAISPAGNWALTGYHGLASHGGALGLILSLFIFYLITRRNIIPLMDILAIATPLVGAFIRIGNFFNSEIVGAHTSLPWAITFPQFDLLPRHPAQLYEALFYLILFTTLALAYKHLHLRNGIPLAISLIGISIFRFLIEFVKEVQVPLEQTMTLNIGQLLSLPFLLTGVSILAFIQLKNTNKIT